MKIVSRSFYVIFAAVGISCSNQPEDSSAGEFPTEPKRMATIEFLTRDGCKNTPQMLDNLKRAQDQLGEDAKLEIIHQVSLASDDPRIGFPTPTILVNGRDIFGMPDPVHPFPGPS